MPPASSNRSKVTLPSRSKSESFRRQRRRGLGCYGKYSFAGLLVWLDEKNYLHDSSGQSKATPTRRSSGWKKFTNGKSVLKEMKPLEDVDTNLRVVRKGNQFTFLFDQRGEGKDWTEMHAEEIELPAKLSVGVAAVNTTNRV